MAIGVIDIIIAIKFDISGSSWLTLYDWKLGLLFCWVAYNLLELLPQNS
jgi:hypothetical protein